MVPWFVRPHALSFQKGVECMRIEEDLIREENRRIRMLRGGIGSSGVRSHDPIGCPTSRRSVWSTALKRYALNLFPGKEEVFDLIYLPRLRRAFREGGGYERLQGLRGLEGARKPDRRT